VDEIINEAVRRLLVMQSELVDRPNFLARAVSFITLWTIVISLTLGTAIFVRH
jgi:hypothetical protein